MTSFGYSVDTVSGRVAVGESDSVFMPRSPRLGKSGVVLLHGHLLEVGSEYLTPDFPNSVVLAGYLASRGIACISARAGSQPFGNNFANDEAMSRYAAAASALQAACPWLATGKTAAVGVSMGGGTGARYAMLNPSLVACVAGICPMGDINRLYVNNVTGLQAQIGTAWGVTYPASLPSGADLPGQAHLAASVPALLMYGSGDTTIIPADVTNLAAAWGSKCTAVNVDPGATLGHGDPIVGAVNLPSLFQFLAANGC